MKKIIIVDFGTIYLEKIAENIIKIDPTIAVDIINWSNIDINRLELNNIIGIILSGSPDHVYLSSCPIISKKIFDLNIPILGICYGMQLIIHMHDGIIKKLDNDEFGIYAINIDNNDDLFKTLPNIIDVNMRHYDGCTKLNDLFEIIGYSSVCISAIKLKKYKNPIYGVQFHPELDMTNTGKIIFTNFVKICLNYHI